MQEELTKRVADLIRRAENKRIVTHSDFLPPEDALAASRLAEKARASFLLCGGHADAERAALFVFADENEKRAFSADDYLVCVRVIAADKKTYAHRDYLGAVLALGLSRDKLGDIVIRDGAAYLIGFPAACGYVADHLVSVSRTGAECALVPLAEVPVRVVAMEEFTESLSSLRADCVVSAVFRLGRAAAAALIAGGALSVDRQPVTAPDKPLAAGQLVALRGYGRVRVVAEEGVSRKGKRRVRFARELS